MAATEAGLLRFITCGSVDDGKSTLMGRLLHDCGALTTQQQARLGGNGAQDGTDFAALLDGLEDERAQGITIDVAWRHFATPQRRFLVADCPGHEQFTRNMASGASRAELAVVLVDATKGLLPQTWRHSAIVAMFGVRQVLLAVNKMDAVGWDEVLFRRLADAYGEHMRLLHPDLRMQALPVSALTGANVAAPAPQLPWHDGPTLLQALERAPLREPDAQRPLRMPVQWVNRPGQRLRGHCGTLAAGRVQAGDAIVLQPSGVSATVAQVLLPGGEPGAGVAGDAVTLVFDHEVDAARGELVSAAEAPAKVSDQLSTHVLWMDAEPLLPGRSYHLQLGTRSVRATLTGLRHRLDVASGGKLAATRLHMNEIGQCEWSLDQPLAFERFADNPALGSFILVDRHSHATSGAGVVDFALRRADNLHWQDLQVDEQARARIKGHAGRCIWLTGLSGAGKSTIADRIEARLHAQGVHTYLLDGDNVRHGLNRDLGFTDADRVENIRRVAEVARLMVDAGLVVLVSFISPFRAERAMARELFAPGQFIEVFVDAPLDVVEARDPKGLYAKARAGRLPNFTGFDSPYEPPLQAEVHLRTDRMPLAESVAAVLARLDERDWRG